MSCTCCRLTTNRRTADRKPARRVSPLRADPTRTSGLRRRFVADMDRRCIALRRRVWSLVVTEDAFGLKTQAAAPVANRRFEFATDDRKLAQFQEWFREQVDAELLSVDHQGDPWLAPYVESSYKQAVLRAYGDVHREALAEKPEFYAGSREQFLRDSFSLPADVARVKLLSLRAFEQLKGVTAVMGQQMSVVLAGGLAHGEGAEEIARKLVRTIDTLSATRARVLARTEIIHAYGEGQLDAYEKLGVEEVGVMAEWLTAGDEKVCEQCAALEGKVYTIAEARGMIPLHPNCVLGDSIVTAADAVCVLRAKYTGPVVKVTTAKGRCFTVTENHILLSQFGFLPAKLLYEGLHLVDAALLHGESLAGPHDHGTVARIAEVFAAAVESRGMASGRVPVAAENLHGDGCAVDAEIDAVWPDGELRSKCQSSPLDQRVEPLFGGVQFIEAKSGLSPASPLAEFREALASAFDRSMGRCRETLAFILGGLLHAKKHGFAATASPNAAVIKPFLNGSAADAELLCECLDRHPLLKQLDDGFRREIQAIVAASQHADILACALETVLESVAFDSIQFGDRVDVLPSEVPLDRIVKIETDHVSDTSVYDVTTASTLYDLNGIVSSNCRCCFMPVVQEQSKPKRKVA